MTETKTKTLKTRKGTLDFPLYIPVTTFGDKYPLDKLIQPYLPRLAKSILVSFHYAKEMKKQRLPVWIDSGGFASLFKNAHIVEEFGMGVIQLKTNDEVTETIDPNRVLALQEEKADVAFTLDFPIPPKMDIDESEERLRLTIKNALWALDNRRRRDMPLFACVQGWDVESFRKCAKAYAGKGFDGIAIGGLVPRAKDLDLVRAVTVAVREEISDLPLHVFGMGKPEVVRELYGLGVDSTDSSSYVKLAANGRLWGASKPVIDPSPMNRLHIALCNLATASGTTLPLSFSSTTFSTHSLNSGNYE